MAKKKTGTTVASSAGSFLRELKRGARVILRTESKVEMGTATHGTWSERDITEAAESVFASALGQRETRAARSPKKRKAKAAR